MYVRGNGGVMILRATAMLVLLLAAGCTYYRPVARQQAMQYTFAPQPSMAVDSGVYRFLLPYRQRVDSLKLPIAVASAPIAGIALGNFVTDACLERARQHFADTGQPRPHFIMLNSGGLRSPLPQGAITTGNIFELMPFDNRLVMLKVTPEKMQQVLDYLVARGGGPVAGITMQVVDGQHTDVSIDNAPIDRQKDYYLVTSNYLANGGDRFSFFSDSKAMDTGLLMRDVLVDHLKKLTAQGDTLKPNDERRVRK